MKENDPVTQPKSILIEGSKLIQRFLEPRGFQFQFREEGTGSGGAFAWGDFVRGDRKLELHFRYSLGMVRYQIDGQSAAHERYMRELGVWEQCRYPGFSQDPLAAFRDLAHDLEYADDFSSGSGEVLRRAAGREAAQFLKAKHPASTE